MKRLLALTILLALTACVSLAHAQGPGASFSTPSGQIASGAAVLVPCGSIVNGQPLMCPPSATNALPVLCSNCSPGAPIGAPSNPVNGTVASTGVFQLLLAQNSARKGCTFQNQSAHTLYFNLSSSPTLASSLQVVPGAVFNCSGPSNVVLTDQITVTGTTGDAFAGYWQ